MIRNKRAIQLAVAFFCAAPFVLAGQVFAYDGEKLAKEAKISIEDARAIALKAHPGKIDDEELERGKDGKGLHYSFDVKSNGKTYDVSVDAMSGKVIEDKEE